MLIGLRRPARRRQYSSAKVGQTHPAQPLLLRLPKKLPRK